MNVHIRMVEYFGGATALWTPDQLKSAITRPCRYEPGVNRTCEDLAAHYGAVVLPARPRKPRDKVQASYYAPSCTCSAVVDQGGRIAAAAPPEGLPAAPDMTCTGRFFGCRVTSTPKVGLLYTMGFVGSKMPKDEVEGRNGKWEGCGSSS